MADTEIFTRVRTICAADIDELGHVNNVIWLRFVVAVGHAHTAAVGLGEHFHERHGATWVVRRHRIDYLRPALDGERIEEATWVSDLRGARCVRATEFRRLADGEVLVRAESVWAFVDRATQRPRRMPAEVFERFAVIDA